jgi:hypothetical protein
VRGQAEQRDRLTMMLDSLLHHRTDDFGKYSDAHVALLHRRSSINDLKDGHQPMLNENGSIRFAPSIADVSSTRFITGISQNMPSGMRMVFATPKDSSRFMKTGSGAN